MYQHKCLCDVGFLFNPSMTNPNGHPHTHLIIEIPSLSIGCSVSIASISVVLIVKLSFRWSVLDMKAYFLLSLSSLNSKNIYWQWHCRMWYNSIIEEDDVFKLKIIIVSIAHSLVPQHQGVRPKPWPSSLRKRCFRRWRNHSNSVPVAESSLVRFQMHKRSNAVWGNYETDRMENVLAHETCTPLCIVLVTWSKGVIWLEVGALSSQVLSFLSLILLLTITGVWMSTTAVKSVRRLIGLSTRRSAWSCV